jgi:hypothetical protein
VLNHIRGHSGSPRADAGDQMICIRVVERSVVPVLGRRVSADFGSFVG